MPKHTRNFLAGKMNKVLDERVVPNGEYIDALNIRQGSTENSEIGVIENSKGNTQLTTLRYTDGTPLSSDARCIGAKEDSANETIYWFVHDPSFGVGDTGKLDMIVSFNVFSSVLTYHIVSIDDGDGENTTLNFNPSYLITGINIVDNLVFFTEGYNPPRVFNRTRNYPSPLGNIDQFTAESILQIKKPPIESPSIATFLTGGQENFIDTRFICFGYRYQYADGEYSATSQFSAPAFVPSPFSFSVNSYLNEGMVNNHNTVQISFDTGGSLVVGIDLLFKEAQNDTIKVIEKLDKAEKGYSDNTTVQYTFNNSKIFTVLPSYEILRLYDNVPRFAKAQTVMGNRLLYGHYTEGYNLLDSADQPVKFDYTAELVAEEIGLEELTDTSSSGNYNINGANTVANSILNVDFSGLDFPLPAGGSITIEVTLDHAEFTGDATPAEESENIQLTFSFFLLNSYASVYAMATSDEFEEAVGTALNIQTVSNSCNGTTFTDILNCRLPQNLDSFIKFESGVSAANQPISIITSPSSDVIGFQFIAMRYVNNVTTPTVNVYEYYSATSADAVYQEIASPQSLHSNRGYEIGIVYMDEFNRSTTALVSENNTVHVPCGNSGMKNSIRVTIPTTQLPPSWATRYKFVIKADQEGYNTIYSSIFFNDPTSNASYFLLEGENAQKVEAGDRFIVKSDTNGALGNCAYATVLEKEVKEENFITIPDVTVPAGVYMKINPNSFTVVSNPDSFVSYGLISDSSPTDVEARYCPVVSYPVSRIDEDSGLWEDYTIPAGSRIRLYFSFERIGVRDACENRSYTLDVTLISSSNYDNFKDWWDGDNVSSVLNSGTGNNPDTSYDANVVTWLTAPECNFTYHFQFQTDAALNDRMILVVNGVQSCTGIGNKDKRKSKASVQIDVFRADNLMIFETEPSDTLPDVFFENHLSFAITNGFHEGNVQDQTSSLPAIIDTEFFNCYTFGNGAESYKIRDSATGQTFNLGNRVTSVAAQDYKETNRFADITYSGVYNDESNVNKLNEFNLGLINYKPLEDSFGPIQILDGRETDILVLQEDKISYVLAGKNLLSDAVGGGVVATIPEVLGIQVARVEKYGISANPESYCVWGYDRYFTDAKRGAVIQLKGNSYNSDQLIAVSEFGMRTYFRDAFIESFNTQKLGGYDPYMNEYVLVINEIELPADQPCTACGISRTINVETYEEEEFCINVGQFVGDVEISWIVTSNTAFEVIGTYNGSSTSSGFVTSDGSITINKNVVAVQTLTVSILSIADITIEINVACPDPVAMQVVEVCVTNNADAGEFIHNEYRYVSGAYTSPTLSSLVTFASGTNNPLVSRYNATSGFLGAGNMPVPGSTVRLICNKTGFDTFDFDAANNKFRYLSSDTLYPNTSVGISALLLASTQATPNAGSGTNQYAQFTMPAANDYLYLIWDYRTAHAVDLCYDTNANDACCDCCPTGCKEYFVSNATPGTILVYLDCDTGAVVELNVEQNTGYFICSDDYTPFFHAGSADVTLINDCGCNTCLDSCVRFEVEVMTDADIEYTPCGESPITEEFPPGIYYFCVAAGNVPAASSGTIGISFLSCGGCS